MNETQLKKIKMHYLCNCNAIMGYTIIDTELSGHVDGILLQHESIYTILSEMMITNRHKMLRGKKVTVSEGSHTVRTVF